MKSLRLLLLVLPVIMLSSCFKNFRTVRNLEGEWRIEKWFDAGEERSIEGSMEFNDCKVRDDSCDGWMAYDMFWPNSTSVAARYEYTFDAESETMELELFLTDGVVYYDIDYNLDSDELVLEYFDEYDDFIRVELQKN